MCSMISLDRAVKLVTCDAQALASSPFFESVSATKKMHSGAALRLCGTDMDVTVPTAKPMLLDKEKSTTGVVHFEHRHSSL